MGDSAAFPSVARKLTLVTTLISGAALLLAGVALGAYDQITLRAAMVRRLSVQAQIIGANSVSALTFNDPAAAEATLSALQSARHILSATIHARDGQPFATYARGGVADAARSSQVPEGADQKHAFADGRLVLSRRIVFEGRDVGSVAISSDLQELRTRRDEYLVILAAVWAVSLLAVLGMSWISRRSISGPITQLATLARRVSSERDYSVRAERAGNTSEIVVLVDAFNDMLAQIQERDQSLREAHEELEARVRRRTAELDAANKELEAFSYSVSHDLRAPLRHVVGFAGLLKDHAKDGLDDQGRKYLQTIIAAATKMGRLIDDLLSFSRMSRSHLARQRVNLNDLVRDARREVTEHAAAGGRTVEWNVADLPEVEGDPAMLRVVMTNLLSNAMKYTAPRPVARIEVGVDGGGPDERVMFVRDNGVGFDMQYAHKLFGVFQRLHGTDEFEGTGVGLANVGRIIQRHGGRVWAEGQVGEGATFYFALPTGGTRTQ